MISLRDSQKNRLKKLYCMEVFPKIRGRVTKPKTDVHTRPEFVFLIHITLACIYQDQQVLHRQEILES